MSLPIRPNVLGMTPYVPGKPIEEVKRELGLERVIKLASNENPLGPSPKAVAAVKAAAERMHMYPDGASRELKAAISRKFSVPAANIFVGNGSDELIHLLSLILLALLVLLCLNNYVLAPWSSFYGILLILCIIFMPRGIVGMLQGTKTPRSRAKAAPAE